MLVVLLPALEQVVRRDVGLVADRDERREAEAALGRLLEQREPERAALRREADVARAGAARGAKVAFSAGAADGDAEAVRADQTAAVRAHEREQRSWRSRPSSPTSAKPGRDHAERADPACAARLARRPAPRAPGTQITARSTGSGISSIER